MSFLLSNLTFALFKSASGLLRVSFYGCWLLAWLGFFGSSLAFIVLVSRVEDLEVVAVVEQAAPDASVRDLETGPEMLVWGVGWVQVEESAQAKEQAQENRNGSCVA